jgi:hypothetical protein
MKINILFLASLLLFAACNSTSSTQTESNAQGPSVEQLEKNVMAVHDEVMPRISDIMKLKKELTGKLVALDSIQGSPGETVRLDEQKAQGRLLVRRLTEADSLMMDWMHNYSNDSVQNRPQAEAARYLNAQQQLINDVKVKINQSITDAKTYLKQ